MPRVPLFLAAVVALPLAAGCTNTCSKACDNIASICRDAFAAQSESFAPFDAAKCANNCKENLRGCGNISDQIDCSVKAKTCSELSLCPSCF